MQGSFYTCPKNVIITDKMASLISKKLIYKPHFVQKHINPKKPVNTQGFTRPEAAQKTESEYLPKTARELPF